MLAMSNLKPVTARYQQLTLLETIESRKRNIGHERSPKDITPEKISLKGSREKTKRNNKDNHCSGSDQDLSSKYVSQEYVDGGSYHEEVSEARMVGEGSVSFGLSRTEDKCGALVSNDTSKGDPVMTTELIKEGSYAVLDNVKQSPSLIDTESSSHPARTLEGDSMAVIIERKDPGTADGVTAILPSVSTKTLLSAQIEGVCRSNSTLISMQVEDSRRSNSRRNTFNSLGQDTSELSGSKIKRKRKSIRSSPYNRPSKVSAKSSTRVEISHAESSTSDYCNAIGAGDSLRSVDCIEKCSDESRLDEDDEGACDMELPLPATAQLREARRLARQKQLDNLRTREMAEARRERALKRRGGVSPLKRQSEASKLAAKKRVSWRDESNLISILNCPASEDHVF